jgi:hypothetical protein
MSEVVLLVDYENVGKIDLGAIPSGVRVWFFFGASQKSVPTEFLKAALKLGERFVPIDIEGHGKNALDFHIAFYLGEHFATAKQARCVILSKDKGFDPLVTHLLRRGFIVQRAATLDDAFSPKPKATASPKKNAAPAPASLSDAMDWLKGTQKNRRPRKRKGLVTHIHTHFGKKIAETEVEAFVDQLIAAKQLTELNGALTYHF